MKREFLGLHTVVALDLTPFGWEVLHGYIDHEDERAGQPVSERPPLHGTALPVEMPVWEAIKIFGPRMVSSARLPFEFIRYIREESAAEAQARDADHLAKEAHAELRKLAKAIGITDDYKAPEQVRVAATMFCTYVPPRVPNAPGWWWLGEAVIQVVDQGGKLVARLNGGRNKPINDEQPWRGPAIVDPRVRTIVSREMAEGEPR